MKILSDVEKLTKFDGILEISRSNETGRRAKVGEIFNYKNRNSVVRYFSTDTVTNWRRIYKVGRCYRGGIEFRVIF